MPEIQSHDLSLYDKFVQQCAPVTTEAHFAKVLVDLTEYIGMDGFTWLFGVHPAWKEIDTRPAEWMEIYKSRDMAASDPILHGSALIGRRPLVWSRYLENLKLTPSAIGVMKHAAKHGLVDGVLYPAFPDAPIQAGLSFFTASKDQAPFVADQHSASLDLVSAHCVDISERIYAGYRKMIDEQKPPEKERHALMVLMHTKDQNEAAAQLGISRNTLKVTIARAKERLGAQSLEEAIGIAMHRRYITW